MIKPHLRKNLLRFYLLIVKIMIDSIKFRDISYKVLLRALKDVKRFTRDIYYGSYDFNSLYFLKAKKVHPRDFFTISKNIFYLEGNGSINDKCRTLDSQGYSIEFLYNGELLKKGDVITYSNYSFLDMENHIYKYVIKDEPIEFRLNYLMFNNCYTISINQIHTINGKLFSEELMDIRLKYNGLLQNIRHNG